MLAANVLNKFSDTFGVSLGFKCKALSHQELLDVFIVGNDAIVYHDKLVVFARPVGVAVHITRSSVSCPSCVSNSDMLSLDAVKIQFFSARQDFVLKKLNFSRGFDKLDTCIAIVSINSNPCGVISTVLQPLQPLN